MKKNISSKKILFSVLLLALVIIIFSSYQTILIGAGRFLAPEGGGKADVVILEAEELVREEAVRVGARLLSSERASFLVIVYHTSESEKIFDRPSNYNLFLTRKLEDLGLKKDQIYIIAVPKEHPITLVEARFVLSRLSKMGLKSAILLAQGFHTRRSFWSYKWVGMPLGIEIIPYPYFMRYQKESWWKESGGIRDFIEESFKFLYYLLRGFIPAKSLVTT
jgi:uncharacterized SAM-binding protein YcdF (DUF218 family)